MKTTSIYSTLTFAVVFLFSFAMKGQPCGKDFKPYTTQVEKSACDNKVDSTTTNVAVNFTEGFNEKIEVYFCGNQMTKDFFKTDPTTKTTGMTLMVDYKGMLAKKRYVIISHPKKKYCLKVEIKKGYAFINLSKNGDDEWTAKYTNCPM